MKVDSAAGEFGFNIKDIELRAEGLVLIGHLLLSSTQDILRS